MEPDKTIPKEKPSFKQALQARLAELEKRLRDVNEGRVTSAFGFTEVDLRSRIDEVKKCIALYEKMVYQ